VAPRNYVLDGVHSGGPKESLGGGAHWCNLANMTEPSMCGGSAAFVKLL